MNETLVKTLFSVLMFMVFIWLMLVNWLFRRLANHHVDVYESLGSPTLFWNNSPRHNWLFLKFLFGSRWKNLSDDRMARVCRVMQIWLVCYFILFFGLTIYFYTNLG